MGKKIKRQQKSFLQKQHEEDEEKEEELILQEKSKLKSKKNIIKTNTNSNIINNTEIEEKEDEEDEKSNEEDSIESINIIEELTEKLNSIKSDVQKFYDNKGKKKTWLEFPVEISDTEIPDYLNPDDDIKRELIFYNIAKENAIKGMIELKKLGEKLNRPDDYFVEMLKSDEQMMKVKKLIINEQQYIKRFEAKKQKMQNIKFAKSMKDFQNKEKSSFKRQTLEGVEKWKKHIKNNPDDYKNIDKFFVNKKRKFNPNDLVGKSVKYKSKEKRLADERFYKKKQMKRPGKVKRMMMRNKKNSKK
jgi:rRNA-processing protein EBP2